MIYVYNLSSIIHCLYHISYIIYQSGTGFRRFLVGPENRNGTERNPRTCCWVALGQYTIYSLYKFH